MIRSEGHFRLERRGRHAGDGGSRSPASGRNLVRPRLCVVHRACFSWARTGTTGGNWKFVMLPYTERSVEREMHSHSKAVVVGAGPAGLTAAYLLAKEGWPVTVLEADPEYVGGLARTVQYKGFHFDIGGHRFFSKSQEVEDFWTEILGNDMLERPRSSRIYYQRKFFDYPIRAANALLNLGVIESARCVLSYAKAAVTPRGEPKSFEDWVSSRFGRRLFEIFFKTYTEKVWGMSCKEISADWAAQRIKGLSLASAIREALIPKRKPKDRKDV